MIYDVIVVGSGIAGLMSAIEAKKNGAKVAIVTKNNPLKSNSFMASGGINAVLTTNQTDIVSHIQDTIKGSKGLSDAKTVEYMCENARRIIYKLKSYGVEFDSEKDDTLMQRPFGGGSIKRTCFVGDKTGSAIISALLKEARHLGIEFLTNNFALRIITHQNQVSALAVLRKSDSNVVIYPTKALILAGGGYAGIYKGHTTNSPDCTGDTIALALKAGLRVVDMEFVQFHPTGFEKSGYLVSEAARGEGGKLINSDGERFVDELATRDVVAVEIYKQIKNKKKVFIDLRHLSGDQIEQRLPSLYKSAHIQAGVDIKTELLPIKPVAHYTMGGIESNMVDTSIVGLFVCGENSANLIHGANRLGGNSLLEGAVFGELAGVKASMLAKKTDLLPIDYNQVIPDIRMIDRLFEGDTSKNFNALRTSLGNVMFDKVGIIRNYQSLYEALDYVKYLSTQAGQLFVIDKSKSNNVEVTAILELRNALIIAEAVILSAIKREESRGSHQRDDYKESDKKFNKHISIRLIDGKLLKEEYKINNIFYNLLEKLRNLIINR